MIHHQAVSHLWRRSLESGTPADDQGPQNPFDALKGEINPFGACLLLFTLIAFAVLMISVHYTLLGVVANLAQVEAPERSYVPLDNQAPKPFNDEGEPVAPNYPEMVIVQQEAITASIRRTLRHLTKRAGFASRWRGLGCAVCIGVVFQLVFQAISSLLNLFLPFAIASLAGGILTSIALARWSMAWTHIVISEPSPKRWFRRVPSFKTWRKIWAPTAISASAQQLAFLTPVGLWMAFGFNDPQNMKHTSPLGVSWKIITIGFLTFIVYVGIVIPAEVALTRCQASMLPEEDESIVPFDRSYGGKVTPEIIGGSGMISYIDAWKSFERPAKVRLVKLYLKIFAIDLGLHILFGLIFSLQLYLVLGSAVNKVMKGVKDQQGDDLRT